MIKLIDIKLSLMRLISHFSCLVCLFAFAVVVLVWFGLVWGFGVPLYIQQIFLGTDYVQSTLLVLICSPCI